MALVDIWMDPDLRSVGAPVSPMTDGCAGCLAAGTHWEHLMLCLCCGYVGCGDSSAMRHARHHAEQTGHPIAQSMRPGDDWCWCFVHDQRIVSPLPEIWAGPGIRNRVRGDRDARRLDAAAQNDVVDVGPVRGLGIVRGLESAS